VTKTSILQEIFDKPLPYEWSRKDHGDWVAEFDVAENIRIEVIINDDFDQGIWYLKFHPTDATRKSLGIRRRDRPKKLDLPPSLHLKVLTTVLAIVKEFITSNKPEIILFYPGRKYQQRMLDAFIQQIPKISQGYVGDKSSGERVAYIIAKSGKTLQRWKEKFHDYFDNPVDENKDDMDAAEWVITEMQMFKPVGVGLTPYPWSWVVRNDDAWIAQASDYDGYSLSITIATMDGGDYAVHVVGDFPDVLEKFKTTMSVVQEFIFKKRPKSITISRSEVPDDGYLDDRFIPGYMVAKDANNIVLRMTNGLNV